MAGTDLGVVSLGDHQQDDVSFNPLDKAGNAVPATVAASGFDATLLDVSIAPDNKSSIFKSKGLLGGPTTISYVVTNPDGTATPDSPITVTVNVVAEGANSANAKLGTAIEQP